MPAGQYKEGRSEYMKRYWQTHPEKYLWWAAKKRAQTFDLPFDIEETDIVIPKVCPILGIELQMVRSGKGLRDASPSLDKRDPSKGYVKGNVSVISFKANRYKSDMTKEDIAKLYEYVVSTNA